MFNGVCVPVCAANETRNTETGVCTNGCPGAGASGSGAAAKGADFTASGTSIPSSVCIGGCSYSAGGGVSVIAGGYYSTNVGSSLGTTCTGNSGAVSNGDLAAKCVAKGQGYGTVNGVIVCTGTQGTGSQPVTTKTPSSSKSTAADGTVTTTEKIETKTCDGKECTIEVEVKDGSGTTKTEETTAKKEATPGSAEFCANNPNSPLCSTPDPCKDNPERAGCKELGTPTEEGALTSKSVGVSTITSVALSQNLSCPADITLPRSMGFSWKPICDSADMLKPLILALAWLGAGYIVMGAAKNG